MKKAVLFIGIAGALEQIFEIHEKELVSQGTMMLTISLAVGAVIGECLRIDEKMET